MKGSALPNDGLREAIRTLMRCWDCFVRSAPRNDDVLFPRWNQRLEYALSSTAGRADLHSPRPFGENAMSLGLILVIILIIFLLGGFSGRFGGYGYGYGHSGMGLVGVILVVLLVLLLLGKL
jgi:hypothetical protein